MVVSSPTANRPLLLAAHTRQLHRTKNSTANSNCLRQTDRLDRWLAGTTAREHTTPPGKAQEGAMPPEAGCVLRRTRLHAQRQFPARQNAQLTPRASCQTPSTSARRASSNTDGRQSGRVWGAAWTQGFLPPAPQHASSIGSQHRAPRAPAALLGQSSRAAPCVSCAP